MTQEMAHLRKHEGLHGGHYQEIPAWGQSQSELVTVASGSAIGDRRFSSVCVHRFSFVAAVSLRFDIAQAVNKVARHMAAPTEKVVQRLKRLLRYLAGTADFELKFGDVAPAPLRLVCSADGSLAPDESRQSTGGYVVRLGSSLISWKVVTAKCILLSTCECELFFMRMRIVFHFSGSEGHEVAYSCGERNLRWKIV